VPVLPPDAIVLRADGADHLDDLSGSRRLADAMPRDLQDPAGLNLLVCRCGGNETPPSVDVSTLAGRLGAGISESAEGGEGSP